MWDIKLKEIKEQDKQVKKQKPIDTENSCVEWEWLGMMTYLDCVIKKAFCEEIIAESWMIRAQIFDERTFQTEGTVKYQGPCGSTNLTYGRNKRRSEGWRSTGKGERRMR